MKDPAGLESNQRFIILSSEFQACLPEVGSGFQATPIWQLQRTATTPSIVPKGCNLSLGAAHANRDSGLKEADSFERPTPVRTFHICEGTERTPKAQRSN